MKIDCSCTIVAGAIQYCEPHKAGLAMALDIADIVSASKSGIPQALLDKLNALAPLFADLQAPEGCVIDIQNGRNVILYCKSHQASYSLASRLIDLADGDKTGLPAAINNKLASMATAIDKARFK